MPPRKGQKLYVPSAPPASELSDWSRNDYDQSDSYNYGAQLCNDYEDQVVYCQECASSSGSPRVNWALENQNHPVKDLSTHSTSSVSTVYPVTQQNPCTVMTASGSNKLNDICSVLHRLRRLITRKPCCDNYSNNKCDENMTVEPSRAEYTQQDTTPDNAFYITALMADKCFHEKFIASVVREFLLVALMSFTIYYIIFSSTDKCSDYKVQVVEEQIVALNGSCNDTDLADIEVDVSYDFNQITSTPLIWGFLEKYYMNLMDPKTFDKSPSATINATGCRKLASGDKYLVGHPQLWKIETRPVRCKLPYEFQTSFAWCSGPYSSSTQVTDQYESPCGGSGEYQKSVATLSDCGRFICYRSYGGGGFVELISEKCTMTQLKDAGWITPNTRAVFLDYAYFFPSASTITIVMLTFELSPSSAVISSYQSKSIYMKSYSYATDFIRLAFWFFFLVCFLLLLFHLIREIAYFGQYSLCCFWIIYEIIMVILIIAAIIIAILKFLHMRFIFYEELSQGCLSSKARMSFRKPLYFDKVSNIINAMILFFLGIKIIHFLTILDTFNALVCAFRKCFIELLKLLLLLWIVFFAFALTALVLFGQSISRFRNIVEAFISIHLFMFGGLHLTQWCSDTVQTIGPIFIIIMYNVTYFLFITMVLATFSHLYNQVKCSYVSPKCRIPCNRFCLCRDCFCMCPRKKAKTVRLPMTAHICGNKKSCRICCPNLQCDLAASAGNRAPNTATEDDDKNFARYLAEIVSKYRNNRDSCDR